MKSIIGSFILFSISFNAFSQSKITGRILDSSDSSGVPFVSVILYQKLSNNITTYTQTDVDGFYTLEFESKPTIFTLKTSRLGYNSYEQDIIIGSESKETVELSFFITNQTTELREVIVSGPVIVKEDTVIYDIEHWKEARDQTLEEVLSKIPGFKINGLGEIQVNGKTVNKVLINGEEVSNSGSALITRSLAPEDVKNVEVRFDEKNEKLKESLLDTREYVVLDIKLKEDLNKSIFGKLRATGGYQEKVEPGGYANIFSLKKKVKIHFFSEHDKFGEQTISLNQIKNIGAESSKKIFDVPADFEALTERKEFDKQIYGFKDYIKADKDIVGVTSNYSLSDNFKVFIGSYNSYANDEKSRSYLQDFTGNFSNRLKEEQQIIDYSSKNKVEVKFDKKKFKFRSDFNAVFINNHFKSFNEESTRSTFYKYKDQNVTKSFYENFFLEYVPNSKIGFQVKAAYSNVNSKRVKKLLHNDSTYSRLFTNEENEIVFDFAQSLPSSGENFLIEVMTQYRSRLGAFHSGVEYQTQRFSTEKNAVHQIDNEVPLNVPGFIAPRVAFNFKKLSPYLKHSLNLGTVSFNNEIDFTIVNYPTNNAVYSYTKLVEYKSSLELTSVKSSTFSISFSRKLSSFPLSKLVMGYTLESFQAVAARGEKIFKPVPEYVIQLDGSRDWSSVNLLFQPALLFGRTSNTNRFIESNEPLVETQNDQLQGEYLALTFPLTKSFKRTPLQITLEPEWLGNQSQNFTANGQSYFTKTTRTLIGVKFSNFFEERMFDFNLYPKFSSFIFSNSQTSDKLIQQMFSVNLITKVDLFNERILATSEIRHVNFFGNTESNFTNLSVRIESPGKKISWFVLADNLLDNQSFVKQSIFPSYFINESSNVFARYFKIGVEFKFK